MLATNDSSKVIDSWTLRSVLNFLTRKLQFIKSESLAWIHQAFVIQFSYKKSIFVEYSKEGFASSWLRPLNTRIDLVEQHLQLGFITIKQMLWTDSQSIENETIGSKEYIHDLCDTFRQKFSVSFHQNHSRFYLNKLLALVVITGDCNTCRPGFADHSIKNATKPTFYDASHLENKEFKLL